MRNRPENQIEIRLTLIRHGATLSNKEGRYLGKTDEALSPEGIGMLKKAVVHSKDTIIRNFPGIRHIRDGSTAAVHCHFRKARAERNSFAETLPDMKKCYTT